jgi:hypothetical protein
VDFSPGSAMSRPRVRHDDIDFAEALVMFVDPKAAFGCSLHAAGSSRPWALP